MTGILYFKRNSGGCVIFGWNCALQDVSSHASQTSALPPDCFGQMRPKRRDGRFGAMCVASAVGPLAVEIVRMVADIGHLAASPSLTLSEVPEANVSVR